MRPEKPDHWTSPELAKIKVSSPQLPPQPPRAGEGRPTSLGSPAPSTGPPLRSSQLSDLSKLVSKKGKTLGEDKGGRGAVYWK